MPLKNWIVIMSALLQIGLAMLILKPGQLEQIVQIAHYRGFKKSWILGNFSDQQAFQLFKIARNSLEYFKIVRQRSRFSWQDDSHIEKNADVLVVLDSNTNINEYLNKEDIFAIDDIDRMIIVLVDDNRSILDAVIDIVNHCRIYQNVMTMTWVSNDRQWRLEERYTINNVQISNVLGHYVAVNNNMTYAAKGGISQNFLRRRSDFHGASITAMTERSSPYIDLTPGYDLNYHAGNDTYEVTGYVTGFYSAILEHLELTLNFSTRLFKRGDGMFGKKITKPNGTYEIVGAIGDLIHGRAEMFASSVSLHIDRIKFVDYLSVLSTPKAGIVIRDDLNEKMSWNLFHDPLTFETWGMMIFVATISAFMLAILDTKPISARVRTKKIIKFNTRLLHIKCF